ncbi:hypothetical protein [Candidatus Coxiella mudrowiae]|nr:hypothetical protein [Candidatus Coxiella mudrowiae]
MVDPEVIVIHRPRNCRKMAEAVVKRTPPKFILVGHSLGGG